MIIAVIFIDLKKLAGLKRKYGNDPEKIARNPEHIYYHFTAGYGPEDVDPEFASKLGEIMDSHLLGSTDSDFIVLEQSNYGVASYRYGGDGDNGGILMILNNNPNPDAPQNMIRYYPILLRAAVKAVETENKRGFLRLFCERILPAYNSQISILNSFDFEGIRSVLFLRDFGGKPTVILSFGEEVSSSVISGMKFAQLGRGSSTVGEGNVSGSPYVYFAERDRERNIQHILVFIAENNGKSVTSTLTEAAPIFFTRGLVTCIVEKIILILLGDRFHPESVDNETPTIYPMTATYIFKGSDLETIFANVSSPADYLKDFIDELDDFRIFLVPVV